MTDKTLLKKERDAFGLTQAQLAKVLGLTTNGYARIERGERHLTNIHRAGLNMLYFISAKDLFREYMTCLDKNKVEYV